MSPRQYKKISSQSAKDFGRIAVLMGGTSAERDISLQSGNEVLKGLVSAGADAFALDLSDKPVDQLLSEKIDHAFVVLHGPDGEDGKIQALLHFLKIPYTGSKVAASALAMDKLKTKLIWQGLGLPTPKFEILSKGTNVAVKTEGTNVVPENEKKVRDFYQGMLNNLGGACFVKPVTEGSSLGMQMVDNVDDLITAHKYAASFNCDVIAETRIVGREFTVAVLNGVALPVIELKTKNSFYDFDAKYLSDDTEYLCPASLSEQEEQEIKSLALEAFSSLSCDVWGRVDFMQDDAGKFYLLEVNTVPGMTSHSLVPMAAKAAGLSFDELLFEILRGSSL